MKTIKQIADELGVSKQKVYRFIVRNHITASSEVKQSKLYDEATEMLIKQGILDAVSSLNSQIALTNLLFCCIYRKTACI